MSFIVSFLCYIARFLISFRYKVEIKNKKKLFSYKFKDKGILFLPNHPAHIDPILMGIYLWPKFKVHPLVVEYIFRQSGIHLAMKLVKAVSIPNLETSLNEVKMKRVKKVLEKMCEELKKKENYLLYPSGRLKHTGKEILGGASATHHILERCSNINIVLVRSTGLWGSSFSKAYSTKSPDFKRRVKYGLKKLLMNLIFFMPRRHIIIEFEPNPTDFPRKASRLELNKYLENWYNRYPVDSKFTTIEPLNKVSYYFWKKKYFGSPVLKENKKALEAREFTSETEKEVIAEISRFVPDIHITSNMSLSSDLGLDSLDIASIISFLSIRFDVEEVHPEDIDTIQDVLELAEGKKKKKVIEKLSTEYTWPDETGRKNPFKPYGNTIQEAFLHICDKMKNFTACGDDLIGVLTYKKLKLTALVLSKEIKKMKGDHIAVLLPAACGTYMVILAILLAGKIPVMLNWTLGPRYLNNMMQLTNAETVISSWRFLERLSNVEFGFLVKKIKYLEDIKKNVSKGSKAIGYLQALRKEKALIKSLSLDKKSENDTAVILFTSGTEASPKGVPLSHKNILSNLRAAMECIDLHKDDVLYGILPPFHSFGFSVTGLFPILCGMRVAFFPDPTNTRAIAEGVKRWKGTLLCSAPSFLKGILHASKRGELNNVRLFISGAEKASFDLFQKIKGLGKKLLEGYGITECAPIVTLNRPDKEIKGVGHPLPGISICTVHPETKKLLDVHEEGEVCIKGPNVFEGYLGTQKSPFVEINNEKWYCSGDLGYLDKDGVLILSGRLKRFAKIAGEMVSLGVVEEILNQNILKDREVEGAYFAVIADEREEGKTRLILFATIMLDKKDINLMLKEAGLSRLVKISDVVKIDNIPLSGTGKIDYRYLQSLIKL